MMPLRHTWRWKSLGVDAGGTVGPLRSSAVRRPRGRREQFAAPANQANTSAKPSNPLSKVAILVRPRSAITARWVQSVKLSAA